MALTVLAIALIGILGGVEAYIGAADGLRTRMAAHWAAMNAIEAARLDPDLLADRTGEEELGGLRFTVEVTVEETDFPGVMRVSARAAAAAGPGALAIAYVTLPDEEEEDGE